MMKKHIPFLIDNLIWALLLVLVVFFSLSTKGFMTSGNMLNILFHSAVLGILVIGQSFTLITGNFDLSMESTLGLAGLLGFWLIVPAGAPKYGSGLLLHPLFSIAMILLVGLAIGWINGNLITRLKVNNFVVTLAMLIALRGGMLLVNSGQTVYNNSMAFNWLGLGKIGPVPVPVFVVILFFISAHIIIKYTKFGRELYAVGANRRAALASGVNPDKRIRQVYLISGILAAFAGWMLAGRLTSVMSTMGKGMIFEVMAAAVIGGISLSGGRGTMIGAFGGVLLLSTIGAGLNLMDVSPFWVDAIRGMIILVAMLIDAQKVRYTAPSLEEATAASPVAAHEAMDRN